MSKTLNVLLYREHVADLVETRGGAHELRYIADTPRTPVSLSMPTAVSKHGGRVVNPFLEGLLPDRADVKEAMGRKFGVSGNNPFAILRHIGEDCAGAVQLVNPDRRDYILAGQGELITMTESEIGQRLSELREDESTSWVTNQEHWSLAGAQAKFAVRIEGGNYYSPEGAEPTTHIIKPGVAGFRDQALNEHICQTALRNVGLRAAETEFRSFDGQDALVVTRYDRRRDRDGNIIRLHQEDMCQALSVRPRDKYESSNGPSAVQIVRLLRESSGNQAEPNIRRFTDGLAANYLLGAPDAHAKNYGVMLAGERVTLTPLYDVASGLPYRSTDPDRSGLSAAAMRIGRENRFGRIQPKHWQRFSKESGVDYESACRRVYELAEQLPDAVSDVLKKESPASDELGVRLLDPLAEQCSIAKSQYKDFRPSPLPSGGIDRIRGQRRPE
ncbi:type II toxin-antitoxin system HipA family toxin [Nesterenkonia alkaliphila]|uniref:Type II toxin-antitoxin system HipA family toxin n=1 Tax=Nesterenkonia alkaliphila TaxID=1463631 RepID=A0A7K1UGN7_9MICC|nr:type II toxin-antitoxin system HipA family toxin [Nesterenkonia alkaliphila]MVT25536.1 type II toxin-antitoxin system HipA family toxin [Nesterenkonia alkaliphila]GFZ91072.1 HipA domain-containing protein [Nesterenkonia alkaliphila]